jgi:tRNA dimethylallyltransferase
LVGPADRPSPPLIGVIGPTASGKTELALALAQRLPVELIAADSRQVYRGMDIGTAKPDASTRASVPHHLLDVVNPDEAFTVAQWVERARAIVPEIAARGRMAMVVGGTGLYVAALVDGHDYASQPWSPEIRQRLTDELATDGLEALAARLRAADPRTTVDLRNPRRVLRALERIAGGGAAPDAVPYAGRAVMLALDRGRDVLYRRIDERTRWMFTAGGLLDEVRRLQDAGYAADLRPMTGHGYREAMAHLAGELSLERAIEITARHTRNYANRQLSWFRRDSRIVWLRAGDRPADDPSLVDEADRLIRAALS